jgi:hypothetical protein
MHNDNEENLDGLILLSIGIVWLYFITFKLSITNVGNNRFRQKWLYHDFQLVSFFLLQY